MKKLQDVKFYITSYFRNLSRERIAIFICIPLSLVALSICAIMLLSINEEKVEIPIETIDVTEKTTEKFTYPPDSPYGIEFESLGNNQCAVSGIGNFNGKDLKIPEKSPYGESVVKITEGAFKNCKHLESISIPSSVNTIEKGAFRGCESLIYINVDMQNESFTSISGVLFSKSKTRLVFYPPRKVGERYYLNPNVKEVDDYAFEQAKNLKTILYPNSTADFEAIKLGKGNEILQALPITCNYTGSK